MFLYNNLGHRPITARCYADRGYATVVRPSVCPSVRPWRWGMFLT